MSVVLNGTTQHLYYYSGGAARAVYPYSMSIWIKPDNITGTYTACAVNDFTGGGTKQDIAQCRGSVAGDYVAAGTYGTSWALAYTSSGYSASTWQHILAVFNSSTDRRIYLDGGSKGTDATNQSSGAGLDTWMVGARNAYTAPTGFFPGKLAYFTVWNKVLTDANAATLAGGVNPILVETGNITQHNILDEDGTATIGNNLVSVGTPTWDGDDNPTVTGAYVDGELTITGSGSLAFAGETVSFVDGAFTITGAGSLAFSAQTDVTNKSFKRRIVVAGSNSVYYG